MRERPQPGSEFDVIARRVGQRIRAQRLVLEMPAKVLAGAAGISPQQMHKYERGSDGITAGRLYRIADALGVSVDALLSDDPLDVPSLSEHTELTKAFSQISNPEERRCALEVVRAAAKS